MALDRVLDDTVNDGLPHPFPFPSHDIDATKAWLADPKSQDFSAWNLEKASVSGKWPLLEALIAQVVGIQVSSVRNGAYAVCREEWGDRPMIKRLDYETQNNIIRSYTKVLQSQCKKGWRGDIEPWISSALRTWMGRAIGLWKNYEKGAKLHAHKHMAHIHKIEAGNQLPTTKSPKNFGEDEMPHVQPESKTRILAESCLHATMLRPICKEYDEIVNHIVRTTEVHGKYDLELQPSWHNYKRDPFDSTAKLFRRVLKDRMIEDGIMKQSIRVGAYRSLAGVHLDHSVRYEDYPDTGLCRWIEDYFSEGYGATVKAAILNIIQYCQQKPQGVYVPPVHRSNIPSTLSSTLASQKSAQLSLVKLRTSDCGEYLDFVNKVVRKALHYTYPQTIYEIDFQLGSEAFQPQRAEQLVGRVFRRMVKDNILEHTGCPMYGGYDLCPHFEAKRFYMRRKLPSMGACSRLDTSSDQSLLRLERFLDANIDSISQKDFIKLYGPDSGSRYDEMQAECSPKVKCEIIDDDQPGSAPTNSSPDITISNQLERQHSDDNSVAGWGAQPPLHEVSYPLQPEMLSPMSDFDSSDVDIPGLEIEREQDTKQELVLAPPDPKPLNVKAIIEKKMKELARKRKLEQAAAHGDHRASKRPHI